MVRQYSPKKTKSLMKETNKET